MSKLKVLKRADLAVSETETLQKLVEEARRQGGFLHVEIRTRKVKPPMDSYKLVVEFHAENDSDATEQVERALDQLDDGFDSAELLTGSTHAIVVEVYGRDGAVVN